MPFPDPFIEYVPTIIVEWDRWDSWFRSFTHSWLDQGQGITWPLRTLESLPWWPWAFQVLEAQEYPGNQLLSPVPKDIVLTLNKKVVFQVFVLFKVVSIPLWPIINKWVLMKTLSNGSKNFEHILCFRHYSKHYIYILSVLKLPKTVVNIILNLQTETKVVTC